VTVGRISLGRAHALAAFAIQAATRAGVPVDHLLPLGSLRRFAPAIGDVSLLAVAPAAEHARILDAFAHLSHVSTVLQASPTSVTTTTERGPITVHVTNPDDAGAALVWHTGSRAHTALLQARARALGTDFADGRLLRAGSSLACPTESELYRLVGLPHIPAELREGTDEIQVAERGNLPSLLAAAHVRGDLHMHSAWSDGRDSITAMAAAARDLGYDYMAITDHSQRARASRALARHDIARQRNEVEAARDRLAPFEILHGIEVDIMPDGTLDFPDELLADFDIVLASLHDDAGQGGAQLMARYLGAMANPCVNVVTHPANRTPGGFSGYDLDFDRLFAAAVETGTALEIDGAPNHLDMDGDVARRAVAAGVTVVVSSDSHRATALGQQMAFGVGTARRGWVEPRHVLNTRPVDEIRTFVAAKRSRARSRA
jgi:DNA polymerase (family 10)